MIFYFTGERQSHLTIRDENNSGLFGKCFISTKCNYTSLLVSIKQKCIRSGSGCELLHWPVVVTANVRQSHPSIFPPKVIKLFILFGLFSFSLPS